jgi:hypothetical protein
MIKQLGLPLIEALYELNAIRLNLLDLNNLDSICIAELIRSNIVICALYYNCLIKAFCKLLKKGSSIISEVVDFFLITKIQNRGSEHEHAFIWIKNAPKFKTSSTQEIEKIVDKYITKNKALLPEAFHQAQTHKRSCTYRKKVIPYVDSIIHFLP